ncbi:MAG: hypothetical protein LAN18_07655 [Acidobacteriia bacterium]|nr:hypothetical protein [Terriglobia bacterium]
MKPKTLILCLILFIVPRATGQEHAPTAAQCQADVAVWGDSSLETEYNEAQTTFVNSGTPNKTDVAKLGWDEVTARQNEMITCVKVDRENFAKYLDAMRFYHSVMADRLFNFVTRHNLWSQLKSEDAQGKR